MNNTNNNTNSYILHIIELYNNAKTTDLLVKNKYYKILQKLKNNSK